MTLRERASDVALFAAEFQETLAAFVEEETRRLAAARGEEPEMPAAEPPAAATPRVDTDYILAAFDVPK